LLALCGLVVACAPKDDGDGAGSGGTETGTGTDTADGSDAATGYPDCAQQLEWVELGDLGWLESSPARLEMAVASWSDSGFELTVPEGTLEVTWPKAEGYATAARSNGDTVVVDLAGGSDDWNTYVRVEDLEGHLWWEGGGVHGGSHEPDGPLLLYAAVPTGDICEDGPGAVVTPMSVEVTADDTVTLASHEAREVTIAGDAYVVHAVTSVKWINEPGTCDDCSDYSASAYLARLQ